MRARSLFAAATVVAVLCSCGSSDESEPRPPGLEAKASAASLALVAACHQQADACVKEAKKHPCRIADSSCMTPSECTAQAMECIAEALDY